MPKETQIKLPPPLYPKVNIEPIKNGIEYSTTLRKQHEGVWYTTAISTEFITAENSVTHAMEMLHRFLLDVYVMILFGKVEPNVINDEGDPVWELDKDQRDENIRLMS